MRKIFITGGCGFIGSHLVEKIFNEFKDSKIVVYDKLTYAGDLRNLNKIIKNKRVKFVKKDLIDLKHLEKNIKGSDLVIHAAAESHVDNSFNLEDHFITTNVMGTKYVLDCCKKFNIKKIIHLSTDEVYGEIFKSCFKENSNFNPSNPYSASKAAAEMIISGYSHSYKLPTMIVRANNIFGTRQHPEKLIAGCCWSFIKKKKFLLHGKGLQKRSFLFVDDFCNGMLKIIKSGKNNEIYNIGSNFEYRNVDIVKIKKKKMEVSFDKNVGYTNDRPFNDYRYSIDFNKIMKLGWKPKIKVEDEIENIIEWYKANIKRYPKRFF